MYRLFSMRSNSVLSLIFVFNIPIILVGFLTLAIISNKVSNDINVLNNNEIAYANKMHEKIFEEVLYSSASLSDPTIYPDVYAFITQEVSDNSSPLLYKNIQNFLCTACSGKTSSSIQDVIVYSAIHNTAISTTTTYSLQELYSTYFGNSFESLDIFKDRLDSATAQAFLIPSATDFSNKTLIYCQKTYPYLKNNGFFFFVINMDAFEKQIKSISNNNLLNFEIYTNNDQLLYSKTPVSDKETFEEKQSDATCIHSKTLNIKYLYSFDKNNYFWGHVSTLGMVFLILELLCILFCATYVWRRASSIDKSISLLSHTNTLLNKGINDQLLYIQSQIVSNVINGRNFDDINLLKSKYSLDFKQPFFRILVIRFQNGTPYKEFIDKNPEISKILFEEFSNAGIDSYFASTNEPDYSVILNYSYETLLHSIVLKLPDLINSRLNTNIQAYYGLCERTTDISNLPMLYEDAKSAIFYGSKNDFTITYFDDIKANNKSNVYYTKEIENQLYNYIKTGNLDECSNLLDKIYAINFTSKSSSYVLLQKLTLLIQVFVYNLIDKVYKDNVEEHSKHMRICRNINITNDPSEKYRFLTEIILSIAGNYVSKEKELEMRSKIQNYISMHFSNPDLSLAMLATHLNMGYHHISHTFADYTGETFISYLTNYRLNYSKELLLQSDEKIDDIAKLSGFNSSNTFIKIFKKKYDMTPGKFRETNKKNN